MTQSDADARALVEWILTEGTTTTSISTFTKRYCHHLNAVGLPVDRIFIGTLVMHPQAAGIAASYTMGEDRVIESLVSHDEFEARKRHQNDPMQHILSTGEVLEAKLQSSDSTMVDLQALKDAGFTGFLGFPLMCGKRIIGGMTLSTRKSNGWTIEDKAMLAAANHAVGPVVMLAVRDFVQSRLLQVYLGSDAGVRVHRGQVRPGQGQSLTAAIMFCDVWGFTTLWEREPQSVVLSLLNELCAIIVRQIQTRNGQVLKFLGDGLLVVFPGDDPADACGRAIRSALAAQTEINAFNAARTAHALPTAAMGIGIHYGQMMYGNVGAPQRLDFTIIGSAVNLAARIESLCRTLHENVLISRDVAQAVSVPVERCGAFALKGIAEPVDVFALRTTSSDAERDPQ
ncbi:MAG: adenylate/guanylate cyclase domain-containing protein [Myxococcota bacterium]|nr:adenylate/guanylate cyclase domain-containing protein [Myxococcota bacterium]